VALPGLAVVVATGVVVLWPRQDRITQKNFALILVGMSRADVEVILGPPGDYTTGPLTVGGSFTISPWHVNATRLYPNDENGTPYDWLTDTGWYTVTFDDSGKVEGRDFESATKAKQGTVDNLLWQVERQWRRWFR
jgi:hypothetical protein